MELHSKRKRSAGKRFYTGLHRLIAGVLCAFLILSSQSFFMMIRSRKVSANVALSGTYDYGMAYRVFQLVNAERRARGLTDLVFDGKYQARTDLRSSEANVLWSHTRPNGQDWSVLFIPDAAPGTTLGENLAWNVGYEDPGANAVVQWLESPGHYAQMMNPSYVTTAVSVFIGTDGYYFAQFFSTAPFSGTQPIMSGQQGVTLSIDDGTSVPIDTPTPIPTNTPVPTQPVYTVTPIPFVPPTVGPEPHSFSTPTPRPTSTPVPTATSTPVPTATPTPTLAPTSTPTPTLTPTPQATGISPTPGEGQPSITITPGGEDETGEEVTGEDETGEDETGEEETGEDETGEEGSEGETESEQETGVPHVESIRFLVEESDRTMKVGDTYELQIQVAPLGADPSEVVFYSTDSDVALMQGNLIHAVGEGSTTILAQAGGVTGSIQFQVSNSGDSGNVVREGSLKPEDGSAKNSVVLPLSMLDVLTSEYADVILHVNFHTDGDIEENDRIVLELTDSTGRSFQIPIRISTLLAAVRVDLNEPESEIESGSGDPEDSTDPEEESKSEDESESEEGSDPEGESGSEGETDEAGNEKGSDPASDENGRNVELTLTGRQILRAIEEETGRFLKNVLLRSGEMKLLPGGDNTIVLVEVRYQYTIPEEALKGIQRQKEAENRAQNLESSAAIVHLDEEVLDGENHTKVLGTVILVLSVLLFLFVILFLVMLVKSVFGTEEAPQDSDESHYGRRSGDAPRRRGRSEKKSVPRQKKKKGGSAGADETAELTSDLTKDLLSAGPGEHSDHGTHAAEQAGVAQEPEPIDRRNPGRRSSDRK